MICLIVNMHILMYVYIDDKALIDFEEASVAYLFVTVLPVVNFIVTITAIFAVRNAVRRDIVKLKGDDKATRWIISHFIR